MEISWFEIIAEIINFFVLVIALNYLFYKPVTKAMEDRKIRVFQAEKDAASKMKQADILIENYEDKIKNVESEKQKIFSSYQSQALIEKEKLLSNYKEEAKEKRNLYLSEIEHEKDNFIRRLRQSLGKSAVDIARKILDTISSQNLEQTVFINFLSDLENLKNKGLDKEIFTKENSFEVTSANILSKNQKSLIKQALKVNFDNVENIEYQIDKNLILGYKLDLNTYTVHNSIKKYLDEVEENIVKILENELVNEE